MISNRRALTVAVADQLNLAKEARSIGYSQQLGKPLCERIANDANVEAGRLTNRLIAIQERIEELDLD